MLSPYLRDRLLTEDEVIAAALAHHGSNAAGRFVQEVVWRTYWKGWLELHPWPNERPRGEATYCVPSRRRRRERLASRGSMIGRANWCSTATRTQGNG